MDKIKKTKSFRMLNFIEAKGNKLPYPVTIFMIFTLIVIAVSHILLVAMLGVGVAEKVAI